MRKYIKAIVPIVVMMLTTVLTVSCDKEDEVPPREEKSMTNKSYKMPDPVELTPSEKAVIDAIVDEYRAATDQ